MKQLLIVAGLALVGAALVALPAQSAPSRFAYGNLYGAAERCQFATGGLPYFNNNRDFQEARQIARQSAQDCRQVQRTVARVRDRFDNYVDRPNASGVSYGNLYGAAERCRISTLGLPYSNDRRFQQARLRARSSRQNCRQVAKAVKRVEREFRYDFGVGYR